MAKAERPNGWQKRECCTCNSKTWHWNGICFDHSEWNPDPAAIERRLQLVQDMRTFVRSVEPDKPTERDIKRASYMDKSLWDRKKLVKVEGQDITGEDWAADIFDEPARPALQPGQFYCSFCGVVVDSTNSLSEKKPLISIGVRIIEHSDGEVETRDQVVSKVREIHACKDHYLKIRKPIVVRTV